MIHSKTINIDLSHRFVNEKIEVHEGDVNGTALLLAIYDNNAAFDLAGCTAKYDAVIAGYLAESDHAAEISNNVITVPITGNMTAMNGVLKIDVKVTKSGNTLFFQTLEAHVQRRVVNGSTIIDMSGVTIEERLDALEDRFPVATADIDDGVVTADKIAPGVIPVVPTNVSAFTNDAGYLTQHQDITGKMDIPSTALSSDDTSGVAMGQIFKYNDEFYIKTSSATPVGAQFKIENAKNKTASLSSSSTNDEYPSAKCVYDMIGDVESLLAVI